MSTPNKHTGSAGWLIATLLGVAATLWVFALAWQWCEAFGLT